jgi:hypothetical protein
MDAYQPRFMLPPNFLFPPDSKLKPGVVLEEGSNSLPDPQEQLHDGATHVVGLETTELPKFHYSGEGKSNTKIGLWLDALSLVEIGLGGERGHDHNLVLDTGPAKISTFSPSKAYISQLMKDPFLAEYTKRPRCRPVYLVTGVMVAENATIEVKDGTTSAFQAKVVINGDGFGVPFKVGPEFEHEASHTSGPTWDLASPFVLAYALKKIRRSMLGSVKSKDHNSHALWDGSTALAADDEWTAEDFTPELEV